MRDTLGIVADVDLLEDNGHDVVRITVESYPYPVSYKGQYYYQVGSTNQLLKGAALDRFLLRRYGRTWDGSPLPGVSVADLASSALSEFRKLAERSGRLDAEALQASDVVLLDKLKLTEGDYLKRAAALLFHPDPLRFFSGSFVKIGYFRTEADLVYHDEVNGDLFTQVRQTLDLLLSKYLKAVVGYEGIVRIERFPVPREALREAVLNALIHRDYMNTAPTQIRVYDGRLVMWNAAVLPAGWTQQTLLEPHSSQPHNPNIANTFFRAGEIEAWGRGIHRMLAACRLAEIPDPQIRFDGSGIWTEFTFSPDYLEKVSGATEEQQSGETSGKTSGKTSLN